VNAKVTPQTDQGELDLASAPADTLVMNRRQDRPYGPGRVAVNGSPTPVEVWGDLTVGWKHRDRLAQTVNLPYYMENVDYGPEATVTYTLKFYGETDTLIRTYSGITGNSQVYTMAQEIIDSGGLGRPNGTLHVEGYSTRGGFDSYQTVSITLKRSGWGLNYGEFWR